MGDDCVKDFKVMLFARPDLLEGGLPMLNKLSVMIERAKQMWPERETLVNEGKCPVCGRVVTEQEFHGLDESYKMEFEISGLCRPCQDEVFG
jgi:hypothetical protein